MDEKTGRTTPDMPIIATTMGTAAPQLTISSL